jgi:hypothetical protein
MRRVSLLKIILFTALGAASVAYGRRMVAWTYEDLAAKSDFVVIAVPRATKDTTELIDLPGITVHMPDQRKLGLPVIGVETEFVVSAVMKGPKKLTRFTLHHYRLAHPEESKDSIGAAMLLSFTPENQSFLMFLVKEKDGRFAPTAGQTDPAEYSIHPLQGREIK